MKLNNGCALVLPERENVPVKTEHISVKYMTCWLWWWQKFWICTRVLEVWLSPVFSSVNCIHKVASLGFSNFASIKMSAEACRKQASRLWLQAPEWLQDMNFLAANIWIGRTKYAHISWYPGQNQKFLLPHDSLESELQPGLVHLDGHVFTLRKVRCPQLNSFNTRLELG